MKQLRYPIMLMLLLLAATMTAQSLTTDQRNAVNALFGPESNALEVRDSIAALRSRKPIWHENRVVLGEGELVADETDMSYSNGGFLTLRYLKNRRALVGDKCTVNKLITVVGVGSWNADMNKLTDEDLNNFAQFNRVVSAGVTVDPIVSIRDMENYYAAGTRAGYCITASSGNAVLTLDAIKAFSIGFYRDGNLVGTKAVAEGGGIEGVKLSLIQVPGSEDATIVLTATSNWVFDEISLDRSGGVQLGIGDLLKVKYAFVGDDQEFPITHYPLSPIDAKPTAGGLYDYSEYAGEDIRLDEARAWTPVLGIPAPLASGLMDDMVNTNLEDQLTLPTVLAVGYQGGAKFVVKDNDDTSKEVFDAGTEVGFKYTMASALALSAGAWIRMILYDRDGNRVQEETLKSSVLGLSLVNGDAGSAAITASVPFSGAEIRFHTVLSLDVGGVGIYYGFVRMKPDAAHRCKINPTMSTDICDSQSTLQLRANPEVSVSWSLVSAPTGSAVEVTEAGYVTHLDEQGEYVFRATTVDGCYEDVTFKHGIFDDGQHVDECSENLVGPNYELSTTIYGSSGSLLSASDLSGASNILSTDLTTYAEYVGGGKLASNIRVVGVKRNDGNLLFDGEANEALGKKGKRIGFVVESSSTALDLSLIQLLQLRCYNSQTGTEVYRHVITENNGVSAGLIESQKTTKMRYTIVVPNKDDDDNYIKMDEFMLWTSGVLDIGVSRLRIYYAFIEDDDAQCSYPLNCSATLISDIETHATINADATQFGGVASVAGVVNNLSFLIDDDPESCMTLMRTVSLGDGITIAVNMGRTLDYHHQLGLIIDSKTYAASIGAGKWMTVRTYYQGTATGDEFSDWSVLGAQVAGYGDKNYLYMTPTAPFDEVHIEVANILGALDGTNFYGLFVRGDIDNDGIPDCQDDESCTSTIDDITINNVCVGDDIVVTAQGTISTDYMLKFSDASASSVPGYDAGDEMVHTMSDASGLISVSYTTTQAGFFQMVFYDGSGTPITSVYYTVHPSRTTWLTTATNSDWNKWDNWSDGSPYCCTDVIIPKGAKYYPELEGTVVRGDEFCCQNIHFEPGAAVGAVTNLDYAQAWVETEMEPNRYHLFAAPLKHMVTGDMFVPESMAGVHTAEPFTPLNSTTSPENRYNPTIYQRRWEATSQGRLWSSEYETYTALVSSQLGDLSLTKWSRQFNHLKFGYAMGQGMSIWVDNGALSDETLFRFRFPKLHTQYTYYDDFTHEPIPAVYEDGIERLAQDVHEPFEGERFIYEPDWSTLDKDNPGDNIYMDYRAGSSYDFQRRWTFTDDAVFPSSLVLNSTEATDHFLFGNPFMSRIDVEKFLLANETNVKAVKFYDGNTLKSVTISGGIVTGTAEVAFIAPVQSVLLETQAVCSSLSLVLSKDMLEGQHGSSSFGKGWPERTSSLELALLSVGQSATLLVCNGTFESQTLLDNEVVPKLAIFGIDGEGRACDVLSAADLIPLGIYTEHPDTLTMTFRSHKQFARGNYELYDSQTKQTYELTDSVRLFVGESSSGRFILRKKLTADNDETVAEPQLMAIVSGNTMRVTATEGMESVSVYRMDGSLVGHTNAGGNASATLTVPSGVFLIRVQLSDGRMRVLKVLAYQ